MKKNLIVGILIILLLILGWLFFSPTAKETTTRQPYLGFKLSDSGDITCTYPQVLHANYQGDEITHELPKPETNPIIMTFSDTKTETPKIKFIDATQTISEVPIVKIIDTTDKMIFLEGDGDSYFTVHTIYKNKAVSSYTKQMLLLDIPIATASMGTCINS